MKVLSKIGRKVLKVLTSPEIVALERRLAVRIAVKVAVSCGAGAGLVAILEQLT